MTKYRITIEEIHEDGTVTPFADENGNARNLPEHEGFVLIGYTDHGETAGCTVAVQHMTILNIADAMRENNVLRSACGIVALHGALNTLVGDDNEEGEDAAN
jgi:hypothetical protein